MNKPADPGRRSRRVAGINRPARNQSSEAFNAQDSPDTPDAAADISPRRSGNGGKLGAAAALVVAIAGSLFAGLSYFQDNEGQQRSASANLKIISFKPDIKSNIPYNRPEHESKSSSEEPTIDGAAIDIVLENTHDQPAIITQIDVAVKDVASLGSCRGAGELGATAKYDFALPTDKSAIGRTFSKQELFQVQGKIADRMIVGIGPESLSEGIWATIYTVSITLHTRDRRLETSDVSLVDPGVANVYNGIGTTRIDGGDQTAWLDCLKEHSRLVNDVVTKGTPRSTEIDKIKASLDALNLNSAVTPSTDSDPDSMTAAPPRTPTTQQSKSTTPNASADVEGSWIAQLFSVPVSSRTSEIDQRAKLAFDQTGIYPTLLNSSDYSSLTPGYRVGYYSRPFSSKAEVEKWCKSKNLTSEFCIPRQPKN
ncbi:hypothetical protein ACFQ05_32570 [Amycolatopsis umgeniensis]|uniref:Uncharacterized protein n=1 Tax=Amycolatopsis umgeniensis TaxID=336628 RepID=A0A841AVI0_9PSEU|nr:hypothetical protein [Amycolatopsis umgeniensis]MBB5850520.1 hypothetical protein [Amycolatopsis umgeniensis]